MAFNLIQPLATVPTDGLVLWSDPTLVSSRQFDGIGGFYHYLDDKAQLVRDATGSGVNRYYLTNGALWGSGSVGDPVVYVDMDGVDDYLGNKPAYVDFTGVVTDLSSSFTWNFWIRTETTVSATIMGQGEPSESGHTIELISTGSNRVFQIRSKEGTTLVNTAIPTGSWTNVTYVKSGPVTRSAAVYINGYSQLIITGSASSSGQAPSDKSSSMFIGRHLYSGSYVYTGSKKIGPVFIYNKALSELEAKQLYATEKNRLNKFEPSGSEVDVFFSYVPLLLHFSGSEGSTTFIDQSTIPKKMVINGNLNITSSQSKFGGTSAYFDGAGDYIQLDGSSDFAFTGGSDFTIEFWFRFPTAGTRQVYYSSQPNGGAGIYIQLFKGAAANKVNLDVNGSNVIVGTTICVINTWYHLALSRYNNITKMFLNGIQEGFTYIDNNSYLNDVNSPVIGIQGNDRVTGPHLGWIDELRVTKGIARYTTNFNTASLAFPDKAII